MVEEVYTVRGRRFPLKKRRIPSRRIHDASGDRTKRSRSWPEGLKGRVYGSRRVLLDGEVYRVYEVYAHSPLLTEICLEEVP